VVPDVWDCTCIYLSTYLINQVVVVSHQSREEKVMNPHFSSGDTETKEHVTFLRVILQV